MSTIRKHVYFLTQILKGRITQRNIPILVTLCITNRCNLRCIYCYEGHSNRNKDRLKTGEILSLIDELCKMGTRLISINGGEALIRDDIDVIINKINEKNILCQLTSNGILMKSKIDVLKKVDSICISIDGSKKSNDLNRGQGTYDKLMDTFDHLYKNNIKFHTNSVLTKNNINAIDEIIPLAFKYGFKAQFQILRNQDSPVKNICLNDEEIKEAIIKIINYKKRGFPIFYSSDAFNNVLLWPFSYNQQVIFDKTPDGYKPNICYMKNFSCHIEADGPVYPCVELVNKFKALNFLEVGFRKAWENLVNNNCRACYSICCNDLNLVLGLKMPALWNAFKIVIDRVLQKESL